ARLGIETVSEVLGRVVVAGDLLGDVHQLAARFPQRLIVERVERERRAVVTQGLLRRERGVGAVAQRDVLGQSRPRLAREQGATVGTLDMLEAIPGLRTGLSLAGVRAQVMKIGCAMIGQTPEIAPADRRIYALRDVTGTVEAIPLIAASIMSKKLAEGLNALV